MRNEMWRSTEVVLELADQAEQEALWWFGHVDNGIQVFGEEDN